MSYISRSQFIIFGIICNGIFTTSCKRSSRSIGPPPARTTSADQIGNESCLALASIPAPTAVDPQTLKVKDAHLRMETIAGIRRAVLVMTATSDSPTPDTYYYKACKVDQPEQCLEGTSTLGTVYDGHFGSHKLEISVQACIIPSRTSNKDPASLVTTATGTELYCGSSKTIFGKGELDPTYAQTSQSLNKRHSIDTHIQYRCARIYKILTQLETPDVTTQTIADTAYNLGPVAFCQRLRSDLIAAMQAIRSTERYTAEQSQELKLTTNDSCYNDRDIVDINSRIDTEYEDFPSINEVFEFDEATSDTPAIAVPNLDFDQKPVADFDDLDQMTKDDQTDEATLDEQNLASRAIFVVGALATTGGVLTLAVTAKDAYLVDQTAKLGFAPAFLKEFGTHRASAEIRAANKELEGLVADSSKETDGLLKKDAVATFYEDLEKYLYEDGKFIKKLDISTLDIKDENLVERLKKGHAMLSSAKEPVNTKEELEKHQIKYNDFLVKEGKIDGGSFSTRSWFGSQGNVKWAQIGGGAGVVGGLILMIGAAALSSKDQSNEGLELAAKGIPENERKILEQEGHALARLLQHNISAEIAHAIGQDLKLTLP